MHHSPREAAPCADEFADRPFYVDEEGILNFRDAEALHLFLTDFPALQNDSLYAAWAREAGAKTDYANHLDVVDALDSLLRVHEADPRMTEERFRPIFDDFARRHADKAYVHVEGVEPRYRFPYHYFVNAQGVYRICGRTIQVDDSELTSFQGRDEWCKLTCTTYLEGNKKRRIKTKWVSRTYHIHDEIETPTGVNVPFYIYEWYHLGEVRAQRRILGIWFKEKRHISLEVDAHVRNVHYHPDIPVDETHQIDFYECAWTNKIREIFADNSWPSLIHSLQNKVEGQVQVTGANRQAECGQVNAQCKMQLSLDCG